MRILNIVQRWRWNRSVKITHGKPAKTCIMNATLETRTNTKLKNIVEQAARQQRQLVELLAIA